MNRKAVKLILLLVGGAAILIVALPVMAALALGLALSAGATRTVYERAVSPDGRLEARVQFDDCGAACSFDRIVLVKERWLNDEPLLSCRAFLADGEAPVRLRWIGPRRLLISHGFNLADITAKADHCGSVRIEIEPS